MAGTPHGECDVLVIEDSEAVRTVIADLLTDLGLSVDEAIDGGDGIRHMLATKPRVVLLDLVMPNVDGAKVMEYMRSVPSLARIPVVSMTASVRQSQLHKPFSIEALEEALAPHLPNLASD